MPLCGSSFFAVQNAAVNSHKFFTSSLLNRYSIFFLGFVLISCKSSSTITSKVLEKGVASWYGPNFHGKKTANGETYNMNGLTAAHRTLPFNTVVKVQNLENNKKVEVRINDRGPFAKSRIIDLSKKAAERLEMIGPGTANVQLTLVRSTSRQLPTDLKSQSFTIQIASFQSRKLAQDKSSVIKGSRVEKTVLNGKDVFRVYFGTYETKEQASHQLPDLKRKGIDGFVKQIEN